MIPKIQTPPAPISKPKAKVQSPPKPPPAAVTVRTATQPRLAVKDGFDTRPARDLSRLMPPPPPPLRGGIPPEVRERLSAAERRVLDEVVSGKQGPEAKADLERLTGPGLRRLDVATQERALKAFLVEPRAAIHNGLLTDLVGTDAFASLSPEQRQQALDVFESADVAGQARLVELANREVNGQSALLDTDKDGVTLLQRLHNLTTAELNPSLAENGLTREALLGTLLQEVADPGEINQSNRGTCTVTSMQYMLCDTDPAEYARIMEGLLTGDGEVELRGGQELALEADSIPADSATDRSATERIFQSAMMEYSNGDERYSNVDDKSRGERLWVFGYDHTGLYGDQQERGMEALFGRDFRRTDDDLIELFESRSPADTYMRMKWGEGKDGGHAVVVTEVRDGRVYFRNPWGATSDAQGTEYQDPPRRLEDPGSRVESMTVEEFLRWSEGAVV